MYDIFLKLLTEKGVRASDVAKATGLKPTLFSEWKSGKATPKSDKLIKIADYFGVSLEYLTTGEDSRPLPESIPQLNGLSALEHIKLIEAYTRLSKENQEHMLSIMLQLPRRED